MNPRSVLVNLPRIYAHGRLGGTGYVSILPVDQSIGHSAGASFALKIFFSFVLILVLAAGFYAVHNRKQLFDHKGNEDDTYASGNLRMWMVILIWIHAAIVTALMIYEV
jgi:hypothetical protein